MEQDKDENPEFIEKVKGDLRGMDDKQRAIGFAASVFTTCATLTRIFPDNEGYQHVARHFSEVVLADFSVDDFLQIIRSSARVLQDIDPETLAMVEAIREAEMAKFFDPK